MKSFIVKITAFSLGLVLIGWLVFSLFLPEYYLPILPFTLLFFMTITILVHGYQLRLAKKDMAKFTRSNLLITFFKLVVYSIFAVVYIALDSANAIPFVVCLMIIYLIYSFIEVSDLTKISKNKN